MRDTSEPPSAWVVHWSTLVPAGGSVLDLACGTGRHARWFRAHGHPVTAVDRDTRGIGDLRGEPRIEVVETDLETGAWPLSGRTFDAVVVVHYLWRPRFADIVASVAPSGVLLYQTFAAGNERLGRPQNPDFLLQPGELLERVAPDLTVVAYEHGEVTSPRPAVVQRIAAVRGSVGGDGTSARALHLPG